jgi:uncharacterized membrane protein YvbJ
MRCPQCGHPNVEEAESCEECGISLAWAVENVKEACPACGTENTGFSTACTNCGYDLERHREKQRQEEERQREKLKREEQAKADAQAAKETAKKNAGSALVSAILGFFICGIILEPMAIQQARKVKQVLRPGEPGYGKAQAAEVIAWIALVLWVLGLVVQFGNILSNS